MADVDMDKAWEVYNDLIGTLDAMELKYQREDDKLTINLGFNGDDLPMELYLVMKPENQLIQLISPMAFRAPEDKRVELACAVCIANYGMIDGSFDYDISDGSILFRLTSSYRDSYIGRELFRYMISVSLATIEKYNDRFFMLTKGMIELEKFSAME